MICVSANSRDALNNVAKWKAEIQTVEPSMPIMLVLTKADLLEYMEENEPQRVTNEDINAKMEEQQLQGTSMTSSKNWEDFNVHKAFVKAISTAYFNKYEHNIEDDP